MIFGFLLAICFDPHLWTAATQPRWALLAVALPLLCAFSSPNHFELSKLLGLLFIAWASLSLIWTANILDGFGELIWILIIAQAYIYGNRLFSLASIFTGLALGITVSSAILIIPALRDLFVNSIVLVYPHGLWGNRNMMGEIAVLTLLGCLVYQRYWYIPGLLPAIFFYKPEIMSGTPSRGALLALVAGIGTWLWSRSKWQACVFAGIVFVGGAAFVALDHSHGSAANERLQVWEAVYSGTNLAGRGLGSLYTLAPYLSPIWDTAERRIDHAHNEFIEILFELGIFGATLYVAIIAIALRSASDSCRVILVGFLVISMFAFPWHIPANAFVGGLVMGHAIRGRQSLRDDYAHWRILLCRWFKAYQSHHSGNDRIAAVGGEIQSI